MAKYNSINNIPAQVFFEILEKKDIELLVRENEEEDLDSIFVAIYDDYFVKSDNPQSKRFLELKQEIFFLEHKIHTMVQVLDFLMFNKTTKEIREILLESLISIGLNFNLENDFDEEVKNVIQFELEYLRNDLSFLNIEMEEMNKENKTSVFSFYESLVGLENIMERSLNDEMTLIKYVEYNKLAVKKADAQKQRYAKQKI